MNAEVILVKARELHASGEHGQALAALASADTRQTVDPELHLALAQLAEQLGDLERAVLEYNLTIRDRPESAVALRRLAALRMDQGQLDRAERLLLKLLLIEPSDVPATLDLIRILDLAGRHEEALQVQSAAHAATGHPSLAAPYRADVASMPAGGQPGSQAAGRTAADFSASEADAINLATQFSGREGVYARQWVAPSDRSGYTPVREPFTPPVAGKHLRGEITVGIYPIRLDQTVNFMAFDLDVARFAVARGVGSRDWDRLQHSVHQVAVGLQDRLAALGLPAHVEDSGFKGRHVWLLFDRPIHAAAARRLAQVILEGTHPLPPEVTLEIFPKQTRVQSDGLGNLIKIPLGFHRKTGRRSLFLRPDGMPEPDQLRYLAGLATAPWEGVLDLLSRPERFASAPGIASQAGPGRGREGQDDKSAIPWDAPGEDGSGKAPASTEPEGAEGAEPGGLATGAPFDRNQDEEYLWLLQSCAVLAEVARRAEIDHMLTGPERRVLTYTAGHLTRGPEVVNGLLAQTMSVRADEFLKSRLRGNPMSCPKIRSNLPEVAAAAACDCRFTQGMGAYPTPLLHLQELRTRAAVGPASVRLTEVQIEKLVRDLVKVRIDTSRLHKLGSSLEARLRQLMEAESLTELSTAHGKVHLDEKRGLVLSLPFGGGEP